MAAIEIKTNAEQIAKNLNARFKQYQSKLGPAMVRGMRQYEAYVVKTQLTGRPGLKRQTGTLARSIEISRNKKENDYEVKMQFNSKYAHVHQGKRLGKGRYSGTFTIRPKVKKALSFKVGDRWVTAKKVNIPKRLFVAERFKDVGLDKITRQVALAMRRLTD